MSRRAGFVRVEDIEPIDNVDDSQESNVSNASSPLSPFADEVLGSMVTKRLYNWDEIPDWQRDNEYILTGYRGELGSWKECLNSAFNYFHNETVNIHSHWVGVLIFLLLWLLPLRHIFSVHGETMTAIDITFMGFFMTGALACLFMSGTYHMMTCHSIQISKIFHRMDYSGIVILTVGSFYPAVYYGFYCYPIAARFWLTLLTVCGAAAAYAVLSPTYSTPAYRRTRTYLFIALGLGGALPLIHAMLMEGYDHLRNLGVNWLFVSAAFYIGGALLYAERFPERFWPGRFDLVFSSHQIFHVCVVLAALSHYAAMIQSISYWHGIRQGQCTP